MYMYTLERSIFKHYRPIEGQDARVLHSLWSLQYIQQYVLEELQEYIQPSITGQYNIVLSNQSAHSHTMTRTDSDSSSPLTETKHVRICCGINYVSSATDHISLCKPLVITSIEHRPWVNTCKTTNGLLVSRCCVLKCMPHSDGLCTVVGGGDTNHRPHSHTHCPISDTCPIDLSTIQDKDLCLTDTGEKGWVIWFQCVKDRFVLPTFWSKYSDLLQGEDTGVSTVGQSMSQCSTVWHVDWDTHNIIYFSQFSRNTILGQQI